MLLHPWNFHLLILQVFLMQVQDQVTEIGGRWNCMENKCRINSLEFQAVFPAWKLSAKIKPDYICCWNWIILQLLHNKKGGTISAACNKLAKDIWNWVKGQDIWITASHVPMVGHYCWSQITSDNEEWFLNERVVKSLFDQIGKREIDLFTSRLNTKCSKYESYKPDPDAYHVNAFSLCWLNLNSYIFPRFSIVRRVLAKLAQDWATALVIVSCWQTQPWLPHFVRLVKPGATPLLIPAHQLPLQLPGTNLIHPIWDRLILVAAILSGTSQQRDCHLTSPRSSEHHGGSAHSIQHTSATMTGLLQQTAV